MVAIIGILAVVVVAGINPPKQLASSRNAQRYSDVNSIVNAIHQYAIDNNGAFPSLITTTQTEICKTNSNCAGLTDLDVLTVNEKYLPSIPTDPTGESLDGAGYKINKSANGHITVSAPYGENNANISVTR